MRAFPQSLVLVGAGKMGGAMLTGWLSAGFEGKRISIIDPVLSDEMIALAGRHGCLLNPVSILPPEVLVLAIKPQMLDGAAASLAALVRAETLIVSVLAGKTIANIGAGLPGSAGIIRTIPNTPAAVGRGITAATTGPGVTDAQRAMADHLLQAIGQVVWVADEGLIDAATAVSGSGPAYVFYLVEALAKAGEQAGLPSDIALQLARATVEGAGELLYREPETSASTLRQNVTSPNGTTAAALAVLMARDGIQPIMTEAVAAAKRRAAELSG